MSAFNLVTYSIICVCFFANSIDEAIHGNHKMAVVSGLFGLVNGVIFFWR